MRLFRKIENGNAGSEVQQALKRYKAALSAFAHAEDDASVDYAVFEMEAAHREYALLSAGKRALEKTSNNGVQA